MAHTVAVIGAGAGGLAVIKNCLDEGLEPYCFERSDHIGGVWHYTNKVTDGHVTVMKNTIANVSKEMTAFSDFPPPPLQPAYQHNRDLEEYLNLYATKFDLKKHIHLNTEVIHVYEADNNDVTGRWHVKVKDVTTGNTNLRTFDAVIVCTGMFSRPIIPDYSGLEKFKGRVIHAQEYKESRGYEGKRVLVVGIGNSAADVAVDISQDARQVYLSSRNGSWILARMSKMGHPIDMAVGSRYNSKLLELFPTFVNKQVMEWCNNRIDHYRYGINPKYTPAMSNSTINDLLAYKLVIGAVKMKPEIRHFTENGVEFVDGTRIDSVDEIIFCTGYLPEFPFLDSSVVGDDFTKLYLSMFPTDRQKQTLAIIGCFRIKGPVLPPLEMQARLVARVIKGTTVLPDHATMMELIQINKRESREKRIHSLQTFTQFDYFPYMDQLATTIGCRPNFVKLFFSDRALAMKCIFGPGTSYQYRLVGPGAWSGARDAIFTQWDRTYHSRSEGKQTTQPPKKRSYFLSVFLFLGTVVVVFACFKWRAQ